jgi:hypothetical protein
LKHVSFGENYDELNFKSGESDFGGLVFRDRKIEDYTRTIKKKVEKVFAYSDKLTISDPLKVDLLIREKMIDLFPNKESFPNSFAKLDNSQGAYEELVLLDARKIYGDKEDRFREFVEVFKCIGVAGIKALYGARDVYGDNEDRFRVFVKVAKNNGAEGVKAFYDAKAVYGDDEDRFRAFTEVWNCTGVEGIKALSGAKEVYGDNDERFQAFVDVLTCNYSSGGVLNFLENKTNYDILLKAESPWQSLSAVNALHGAKDVYGDNDERFQAFFELVKIYGAEGVKVLYAVKDVYGDNDERFQAFFELAKRYGAEGVNVLYAVKDVYGDNDERFQAFFELAKRYSVVGVRKLFEAKDLYGDNEDWFKFFAKVVDSSNYYYAVKSLVESKEFHGVDDAKIKMFIFLAQQYGYINLIKTFCEKYKECCVRFGETLCKDCVNGLPSMISDYANREMLKELIGERNFQEFLEALPKSDLLDEKRNAFTHNEYDRTSALVKVLTESGVCGSFVEALDFQILREYIKDFGLSKTPILYSYYRNIKLFESGLISSLPDEQVSINFGTIGELKKKIKDLKNGLFSTKSLKEIPILSDLELEILSLSTGKSVHSHDSGRPSLKQIIDYFNLQMKNGEIAEVPEEYDSMVFKMNEVRMEFQSEEVKERYFLLKEQVLLAQDDNMLELVSSKAIEVFERKLSELKVLTVSGNEKKSKLDFFSRQIELFQKNIEKLKAVANIDEFLEILLSITPVLSEIVPIMRVLVFAKIFEKHEFSNDMLSGLRSEEITVSGLMALDNILSNYIKDHVLSKESDNKENYWSRSAWDKIKKSKKSGFYFFKLFSKDIEEVRLAVSKIKIEETDAVKKISVIPDRGFAGEMSAYLGNVCYSAENPLLSRFPNLVPYKFVMGGGKDKEFVGSLLVFELESLNGEKVLLIRPINIPNERMFDVGKFFEKFVNKLVVTAKKRGIKKILIPNDDGAISNYPMIRAYLRPKYLTGKAPVPLKERFAFNGHDITNRCFTVREID